MKIDYDKLIVLLLPVRLRTVRLFSLIQVMLAPIKRLHDEFHAYADLRRLRASATPQALMIEQIVLAETGVSIQIVPVADTISTDFEVKHPDDASAADVLPARSVVDRYKLAGKTYRVVGSVIPFSHEWSDYVCAVGIYSEYKMSLFHYMQVGTYKIEAIIESVDGLNAASDVQIVIHVTGNSGFNEMMTFVIPAGSNNSGFVLSSARQRGGLNFALSSIDCDGTGLSHDSTYVYTIIL